MNFEPLAVFSAFRAKEAGPAAVVVKFPKELGFVSHPLPLYLEYVKHSPDGFQWGYSGSGPSQLAFAMLMKTFELHFSKLHMDDRISLTRKIYVDFREEFVAAPLSNVSGWSIPSVLVAKWIIKQEAYLDLVEHVTNLYEE